MRQKRIRVPISRVASLNLSATSNHRSLSLSISARLSRLSQISVASPCQTSTSSLAGQPSIEAILQRRDLFSQAKKVQVLKFILVASHRQQAQVLKMKRGRGGNLNMESNSKATASNKVQKTTTTSSAHSQKRHVANSSTRRLPSSALPLKPLNPETPSLQSQDRPGYT